ncbi:hypothetical protein EVAR_41539_1 [Eumeta japonica]|uniref:Uncharacterized protein n=1 Tax=Eumeta variegata TaxID=151549 RepID=A0A4C1X675_EUMVA|nr:hypothetical protein EVAR_41539_1 [Eumeta japonica]
MSEKKKSITSKISEDLHAMLQNRISLVNDTDIRNRAFGATLEESIYNLVTRITKLGEELDEILKRHSELHEQPDDTESSSFLE